MNRLTVSEISSIGAVPEGDNPEAEILFWKRKVSDDERDRLASRGQALPDGSYPIASVADLRNAIQAFGRAANKAATKRHIIKRARALGRTDLLPEDWMTKDFELEDESRETVESKGDTMAEQPTVDDGLQDLVAKQAADLDKTRADLEAANLELEELRKERDDASDELAKERKVRRDAEFLAKAEALEPVLGDPSEWAPVLDTIETAAPDVFEKLAGRLTELKGQFESADIFKELGRQEGARTVDALVKSKRENNPNLSEAEARAEVWRENPDLVAEAREGEGA